MAFDPIIPHWPDKPPNVQALALTRGGGCSAAPYDDGQGGGGLNLGQHVGDDPDNVARNRATVAAAVAGQPTYVWQVHGTTVADAADIEPGTRGPDADALLTTTAGRVCAIMTADCLPVLFADVEGGVVGAAHAGWRGLAAGVLHETVAAMRAKGAQDITAWLGPAIGPAAFEVGADVLAAFEAGARDDAERALLRAAFVAIDGSEGKYLADMYALARVFLARDGVVRVSGGTHCTVTEHERFFSYRRDGVTGRQATLVWFT